MLVVVTPGTCKRVYSSIEKEVDLSTKQFFLQLSPSLKCKFDVHVIKI